MELSKSALKILTSKPIEQRLLGRPTRGLEDAIRMHFKEIGVNTRFSVNSVEDRGYWKAPMNAVFNLRVPYAKELVNFKFIANTAQKIINIHNS